MRANDIHEKENEDHLKICGTESLKMVSYFLFDVPLPGQQHVADGDGVGQQHAHAVDAEADAARGGML